VYGLLSGRYTVNVPASHASEYDVDLRHIADRKSFEMTTERERERESHSYTHECIIMNDVSSSIEPLVSPQSNECIAFATINILNK